MMDKKKILIGLAALIVIVVAAFVIFKRDSDEVVEQDDLLNPISAEDIYDASNTLEVNKGSALVKRAAGDEETITDKAVVEVGDTIIIADASRATLYWFDSSVSRLSAGTELKIDEAAYNPENITETDIEFEVVKGEVWSKVQAIVDEDSEFLSHAGSVVAGVRGSVYNFAVDDDLVQVSSIAHAMNVEEITYVTGEWGSFDKESGKNIEWGDITEEMMDSDWFQNNVSGDKGVKEMNRNKALRRFARLFQTTPGEQDYNRSLFLSRLNRIDELMRSDMSETEKAKIKAKIVHLVRAINVTPNDPLYAAREILEAKLIEWETDETRKKFLKDKLIERQLYLLSDWLQEGEVDQAALVEFLKKFQGEDGSLTTFFEENPELVSLVDKILEHIEEHYPSVEVGFLEAIAKLNDEEEETWVKPTWTPPATEPSEEIIKEAPFHQGESNV